MAHWTLQGTGRLSEVPCHPWVAWIRMLAALVPSLLLAYIVSFKLNWLQLSQILQHLLI
jgi:hypothetical protein